MIARIKGTVLYKTLGTVVVDTGSLAYEVYTTQRIIKSLLNDSAVSFLTIQHHTETETRLYGFETIDEKETFQILTAVSGVGPKSALGILSNLSRDEIYEAVEANDITPFTAISGIGTKNATRIVVELKSKSSKNNFIPPTSNPEDEVIFSALQNLGFTTKEVQVALKKVEKNATTEQKITEIVKLLGSA